LQLNESRLLKIFTNKYFRTLITTAERQEMKRKNQNTTKTVEKSGELLLPSACVNVHHVMMSVCVQNFGFLVFYKNHAHKQKQRVWCSKSELECNWWGNGSYDVSYHILDVFFTFSCRIELF
jgi:hypothetical protein